MSFGAAQRGALDGEERGQEPKLAKKRKVTETSRERSTKVTPSLCSGERRGVSELVDAEEGGC